MPSRQHQPRALYFTVVNPTASGDLVCNGRPDPRIAGARSGARAIVVAVFADGDSVPGALYLPAIRFAIRRVRRSARRSRMPCGSRRTPSRAGARRAERSSRAIRWPASTKMREASGRRPMSSNRLATSVADTFEESLFS